MVVKKIILFSIIISMIILTGAIVSTAEEGHLHHDTPSANTFDDTSGDMEHSGTTIHPEYPDMFETKGSTLPAVVPGQTGIDEKLGHIISPDIQFLDENANTLMLGNFIDRPTLILPIFYHCPKTYSLLLSNLS